MLDKKEEYRKNYQKKWYATNRERVRKHRTEYKRRYRQIPKNRISKNLSNVIYETLKGKKNRKSWESLVGYTIKDLMRHLQKQFKNGMSWKNYGSYWHLDHIVPISNFNYNSYNDPQFRECWSLKNLRPALASDNMHKHNKGQLILI